MARGRRFDDRKLGAERQSKQTQLGSFHGVSQLREFNLERRPHRAIDDRTTVCTSFFTMLINYANSLNRPEFFSSKREILTSLDPDISPETQAEAASEILRCSRSLRSCHSRNVARSCSITSTAPAIRIRYWAQMASISSPRRSLSQSLDFSNCSRRLRWPSSYSFSTRCRWTASCSISSTATPAASRAIMTALCLPAGERPCKCPLPIISATFKISHAAVDVAGLKDDLL